MRFDGVTPEEVRAGGSGLHEVTSTGGVRVRLHDMSFLDLTYEPASPPSLVLRFLYDDPAWTPVEALSTAEAPKQVQAHPGGQRQRTLARRQ